MSIWIDTGYEGDTVGRIGFLVRYDNNNRGTSRHALETRPAYTNQSHEPRLHGWCGETDNVSVHACGLARVCRVTSNGRACLARVQSTPEALEALGYPELG